MRIAIYLMAGVLLASYSTAAADTKIAFRTSGTGDVFVMNPDGTELTQLTDVIVSRPEDEDSDVSRSPDGSRFTFSSERSGDARIWVIDADGSNPVRLTDLPNYERNPEFSPDGSKIVFGAEDFDTESSDVWVCGSDGSDCVNLTDDEDVEYGEPTWSPDATKIAFVREPGEQNAEIWVMNADGTGPAPIVAGRRPDWAPVGTRIVFDRVSSFGGSNSAISLVNADGTDLRILMVASEAGGLAGFVSIQEAEDVLELETSEVVAGGVDGSYATWSPDGSQILLLVETVIDFSERYLPHFMDADGENLVNVSHLFPERAVGFNWTDVIPGSVVEPAQPTVSVSNATGEAGGNVLVKVGSSDLGSAAAGDLSVRYDASALTVVRTAVLDGGASVGLTDPGVNSATPGEVKAGFSTAQPPAAGAGDLFEIEFKIAAGASGTLPLTVEVVDNAFFSLADQPLPVTAQAGEIRVESGTSPPPIDEPGDQPPPAQEPGDPFSIRHIAAQDLPAIDGDLSDWEQLFGQPQLTQTHFSSIAGEIGGPVPLDDQKVEVWLGWNDDTNLIYLAARVMDNSFGTFPEDDFFQNWRSDNIEVFIDADNSGGPFSSDNSHAQQYLLRPAFERSLSMSTGSIWTAADGSPFAPGVAWAWNRVDGEYIYELAFPGWNSVSPELLPHDFQIGQVIGFGLGVADFESDDDALEFNYHAYNSLNGASNLFRDADGFTDFQLLGPDGDAPPPATDPVVARFSANVTRGFAPLAIAFLDSSTGATDWQWNFGDGASSTADSPFHTYTAAGTYTVTLTVTGAGGSDSQSLTITVADAPIGDDSIDPFTIRHIPSGELPTIDGDLSDWEQLFGPPQLVQHHFTSTLGEVVGTLSPNDQGIEVWLGWNGQTNLLYLAARVTDNAFGTFQAEDFFQTWRSDNIEVFLDADNSGGPFDELTHAQEYLLRPSFANSAVMYSGSTFWSDSVTVDRTCPRCPGVG